MWRAIALGAVLWVFAAGCGGSTYHGEGDVVAVDATARQVTINHEDSGDTQGRVALWDLAERLRKPSGAISRSTARSG